MKLEIDLSQSLSPVTLKVLAAILLAHGEAIPQPTVATPAVEPEKKSPKAPKEKKETQGAPEKAIMVDDTPTIDDDPFGDAPSDVPALTAQYVSDQAMAFKDKAVDNLDKLKAALKAQGATKITDLKPEQYRPFLAAIGVA